MSLLSKRIEIGHKMKSERRKLTVHSFYVIVAVLKLSGEMKRVETGVNVSTTFHNWSKDFFVHEDCFDFKFLR